MRNRKNTQKLAAAFKQWKTVVMKFKIWTIGILTFSRHYIELNSKNS